MIFFLPLCRESYKKESLLNSFTIRISHIKSIRGKNAVFCLELHQYRIIKTDTTTDNIFNIGRYSNIW